MDYLCADKSGRIIPNATTMTKPVFHSTTVVGLIHNGTAAMGADGQATFGATVMKSNVRKIRKVGGGKVLAGFAGATADAFTLLERFDEKLSQYGQNMKRAAVELARDWRTDRFLRRLEAMLVVMNETEGMIISGTGDVLEPDHRLMCIGSGGMYAQAAALTLLKHASHLTAEQIVRESLHVAADICIYTNHNFEVQTLGA
jgi:ATP-dependent HslUV protease subunit HslV